MGFLVLENVPRKTTRLARLSGEGGQSDEEYGEECGDAADGPTCRPQEGDGERDEARLWPSTGSQETVSLYSFHAGYSASYGVPVLYFEARHPGTCL
jgi:hypothetical protein